MKNNSELNEFIERLVIGLQNAKIWEPSKSATLAHRDYNSFVKAARILHELATNPKYEDMNAREALDDLIGGV